MALYLPRNLLQWREKLCPTNKNYSEFKKETTVSTLRQRGPHIVSLFGVRLWRGQAYSTDQKMPKKPARLQLAQQRSLHLPSFDCSHPSDSWFHRWPFPSRHVSLPRFLLSPPSGRNVSTHFSLLMLCVWQTVGERSLRWCCAGERPVMFENRRCLAAVKSTCVWTFKESVQSARMYAQVCFGNYLFKLFKEIYVKASISVFCLEISVVWNVRFKPQLQANSPKPLFYFSKCQIRIDATARPKPHFWLIQQFAKKLPLHWSAHLETER